MMSTTLPPVAVPGAGNGYLFALALLVEHDQQSKGVSPRERPHAGFYPL
jgi:hypothetical protein